MREKEITKQVPLHKLDFLFFFINRRDHIYWYLGPVFYAANLYSVHIKYWTVGQYGEYNFVTFYYIVLI